MKLGKKRGSAKGVPKPLKRKLDEGFAGRLSMAMAMHPEYGITAIAKKAGCSRQVIHNLLQPGKGQIEALLLFELADIFDVSPRWLLLGEGVPGKGRALTPDEQRILALASLLNEGQRDLWVSQGEEIRRRSPQLIATNADPFRTPVPQPDPTISSGKAPAVT